MMSEVVKPLFVLSLKNPREAALGLVRLEMGTQTLWLVLSLVSVITSLVLSLLLQITPLPNGEMGEVLASAPGFENPLIMAVIQWGRIVLSVFVFYWVGRFLGGQGTLGDVLAVVTWLQLMSFALMVGITFLGFALPFLSPFALLIFICWWLFSLVTYVDVAHSFGNMLKATGVIVASIVGVLIGMTLFMGVIGGIFVSGVGGS